MNDIEWELKEVNEYIKELFNFNGGETQLKHFKETFTNYINDSNNGPNYFIKLLDFYSQCRPHQCKPQHNVSKELIECVSSSFPEQNN